MAYYMYFAIFTLILITHEAISPVRGQCTVQGCDNRDPLNSIVAEMQQLKVELFDQLNKQVQIIHEILNASLQKMRSQHTTSNTIPQAIERRLMGLDICIKQGQSIHELLNESRQEMKSQHDIVVTSLQAHDLRLQEHDISIKNQSQNVWELANGACSNSSDVCDCSHIKPSCQTASGVYEVCVGYQPNRVCTYAYCDMERTTSNGASLVFQRRKDGSVNFNRTWEEYKRGFGNRNGEFWIGNEMLHLLTSKRNYKLRVDLEDFQGNTVFAEYTRFFINSSANNYSLTVSGYSGNAGDSLTVHSGSQFSTRDAGNSGCVRMTGGGWWLNPCFYSNLNGIYTNQYNASNPHIGLQWYFWRNSNRHPLKASEMKLVPVS